MRLTTGLTLFKRLCGALVSLYMLAGCATLTSDVQSIPVTCDMEPCTVKVNGEIVGQAPLLITLPRGKNFELTFQGPKEIKTEKLEKSLRTKDGIYANLLPTIFNVGSVAYSAAFIGYDYYTGNIWKYNDPIYKKSAEKNLSAESTERIVILPPIAKTKELSDQVVAQILSDLRVQFPKAQIEVPEINFYAFDSLGISHKEYPQTEKKWFELIGKTGTLFFVLTEAKIDDQNPKKVSYQLEIKNLVSDHLHWAQNKALTLEKVVSSYDETADLVRHNLVPNAVSLRSQKVTASGWSAKTSESNNIANIETYSATSGSAGQSSADTGSVTVINFSNVDPYIDRTYRGVMRWATDVNFKSTEININKSVTTLNYNTFAYSSETALISSAQVVGVSAGIGPEFGVAGPLGYLYTNFLATANADHYRYSTSAAPTIETFLNYRLNIGYSYQFAERWQLGFSVGIASIPEDVMNRVFERLNVANSSISSLYQTFSSVGLSYYIPEIKTVTYSRIP